MIYGFSGKPSAGKSYTVVEQVIIPALKKGRTIYHNMQLHEDRLRALCGEAGDLVPFARECTPEELVANAPDGALIIIDESVRYWPSGIKSNKVPKEQIEFFTMHRHRVGPDGRSSDIVLVCQDFGSQCAAFIRELIAYTYYAVKLSHMGLTKKYRLEVYEGFVKGGSPSQKKLIRKSIERYRPQIYQCYVSHTLAQKGVAGEELRDQAISVWKNWRVLLAAAAIPVCIGSVLLAIHSVRLFQATTVESARASGPAEHREAGPMRAPNSRAVPVDSVIGPAVQPLPSKRWRLAGEIVVNGRRRVVLDGGSSSRYAAASDCKLDPVGNRTCVIAGELVATWTGIPAPALNRWFAASATPGVSSP